MTHPQQEGEALVDVSLDDDLPVSIPTLGAIDPDMIRALNDWLKQSKLDDDQRLLVYHQPWGVVQLQANAGSGKTHSLVSRTIKLICQDDVHPTSVILITFTNRAAKEIKERYLQVWKDAGWNFLKGAPPMPFIGTIHALAYTLLIKYGQGLRATILNEGQGKRLLRRYIKELFPGRGDLLDAGLIKSTYDGWQEMLADNEAHLMLQPDWQGVPFEVKTYRHIHQTLPMEKWLDATARTTTVRLASTPGALQTPDAATYPKDLKADIRAHYLAKMRLTEPEALTLLKHFVGTKWTNQTLEFTDILYYCLTFFAGNQSNLNNVQTKYHHVLLDEAQDTDSLQFSLLMLLFGGTKVPATGDVKRSFTIVSDPKQTLYFWRNARPDYCEKLDRIMHAPMPHPTAGTMQEKVHTLYLRTNYRSTEQLVKLANHFAANFETRVSTPSIPFHPPASDTLSIKVFDTTHQENKFIAQEIADLVKKGKAHYRDFAILTRTNRALLDLEASFIAAKVPYHLKHDNRATTKQSTFRVFAGIYALLVNGRDVAALAEITEAIKGNGPKFLVKLQQHFEQLFARDGNANVYNITDQDWPPQGASRTTQHASVTTFIQKILTPLRATLKSNVMHLPDFNGKIVALLNDLGTFDQEPPGRETPLSWSFTADAVQKVSRTLSQIYWSLNEEDDFARLPELDKLMAIHALLALGEDDREEDDPYVAAADELPEAAKKNKVILSTGHAFKGKQAPYVYVSSLNSLAPVTADPEEERMCWFYVAVTRSMRKLTLTASQNVMDFAGKLRPARDNFLLSLYTEGVMKLKAESGAR